MINVLLPTLLIIPEWRLTCLYLFLYSVFLITGQIPDVELSSTKN